MACQLTESCLRCLSPSQSQRPFLRFFSAHAQNLKSIRSQNRLPAAYYRGGTSRAIIFNRKDLPENQSKWDAIFRGCIGSPDPNGRQLDGLGGGISSLSKVCVVGRSTRPDADVDYTFAALGIRDTSVDYSSNCGNMSAAIGPFAIDSHILPAPEKPDCLVRIHNTNTSKIIHSSFPIVNGEAAAAGDFAIDGVSGTAARVRLDFINPAGSRTGKLLPTGNVVDIIDGVRATLLDAGNPCCFIKAEDLGVPGTLTPQEIEEYPHLLKRLDSIRCQAGVMMGLAATPGDVPGSIPKISFVSPSKENSRACLVARAISVGQPHRAIPVTVALATAAAAKLPGTVVFDSMVVKSASGDDELEIQHASGSLVVTARYDEQGDLASATVFRTARRLMDGNVYWK